MGLFNRKDEVKLFEYIDDIAKKVACTYVGLLSPTKKIQDEDLHMLANDKIISSVAVFCICFRQVHPLSAKKIDTVMPILMHRTVYHLTNEVFSNSTEDNHQEVSRAFDDCFDSYYPLSSDIFKLFSKLSSELNLVDSSDDPLSRTMLVADTITSYVSRLKINEFFRNIKKLA